MLYFLNVRAPCADPDAKELEVLRKIPQKQGLGVSARRLAGDFLELKEAQGSEYRESCVVNRVTCSH